MEFFAGSFIGAFLYGFVNYVLTNIVRAKKEINKILSQYQDVEIKKVCFSIPKERLNKLNKLTGSELKEETEKMLRENNVAVSKLVGVWYSKDSREYIFHYNG